MIHGLPSTEEIETYTSILSLSIPISRFHSDGTKPESIFDFLKEFGAEIVASFPFCQELISMTQERRLTAQVEFRRPKRFRP